MVCIRILCKWRETKAFFIECLSYPFCSFEMPFLVYFHFVELLIQHTLSLTREDKGYLKWKDTHSRGASSLSCFLFYVNLHPCQRLQGICLFLHVCSVVYILLSIISHQPTQRASLSSKSLGHQFTSFSEKLERQNRL